MKNRSIVAFLFIVSFIFQGFAQGDPTEWKFSLEDKGNGEVELVANVAIEQGWYIYGTKIPEGGPYPTSLSIDKVEGAVAVGGFEPRDSKLNSGYDAIFEMTIGSYEGAAKFVQRFKVTDKAKFVLEGDIRSQACNGSECTPPLPVDFAFKSSDLPATVVATSASNTDAAVVVETTDEESVATTDMEMTPLNIGSESTNISSNQLWNPVVDELQEYGLKGSIKGKSLWWVFIAGFL